MKIKFTVPGEPKGKARPRFARAGNFVRTYTPKETDSYEKSVRAEYLSRYGDVFFDKGEMLDLRVFAYYSIPKNTSKKMRTLMLDGTIRPIKKPDMDNIIKIIADSLNKTAYHDDAQIVDSMARKFYSENPRVEIILQTAGG